MPRLFYASTECDSQATRYNKTGNWASRPFLNEDARITNSMSDIGLRSLLRRLHGQSIHQSDSGWYKHKREKLTQNGRGDD